MQEKTALLKMPIEVWRDLAIIKAKEGKTTQEILLDLLVKFIKKKRGENCKCSQKKA